MSITLDTITHAVNSFNDIPDITFDSIDIGEFANEVEIYTNTPAVLIPTKLNAMASSMKTWLNSEIAAPLQSQQNTFKNEVVGRTNEAMTAVETYINNEVKAFVNDIFVPWANNSGAIISDNANLLETNVSTTLSQLQTDYSVHVQQQDAIISQALLDIETNLAQYTTGATDSGYSVHQTNELVAGLVMTAEIDASNYSFDSTGINITSVTEGDFTTHHVVYDVENNIVCFGEALQISGEVRPFVNHNVMTKDSINQSLDVEQVKSYSFYTQETAGGIKTFRAIGHEADGSAAVDLTILNNTSIPDTDNPEITLTRGVQYAMIFDGIDQGEYVIIKDADSNDFNAGVGKSGVAGQYCADGGTILFRPFSSYCHDSYSGATGWGVQSDLGASLIEGALIADGSDYKFDSPLKCEQYFDSDVTILDDFSRSYEYDIPNESYDSTLFDGMIYKVQISDQSGFSDTFNYTIDHNGKLGTGATVVASYDNGCSDVTITNDGAEYSANTFARVVDVNPVTTEATASVTLGQGTISAINVLDNGTDFSGYWEITLPDNASGHTHTIQLLQAQVDTIKSGAPVLSTTVDSGHTHDVSVSWNAFLGEFMFELDPTTNTYDWAGGDHDHGPSSPSHEINPNITLVITGDGANATGYVLLNEAGGIGEVIVTDGGIGYTSANVIFAGGTPTLPAYASATLSANAIQSINVNTAGSGYADSTPAQIDVTLQNNQFIPPIISAKVGDTIAFTNNDLNGHTVVNVQGAFTSPNIPQNGTWTYEITKDTQITDLYEISGSGMATQAELWVRENTVYVDIVSATGGGARAKGTIDAAGTLVNIDIIKKGFDYQITDEVRIMDVSGPGEGSFASAVLDRSLEVVSVLTGGTGYDANSEIVVVDPTGWTDILTGAKTFGYGAKVAPVLNEETGAIESVTVLTTGTGYKDIDFIIIGAGTGASLAPDLNVHIEEVAITSRGSGYEDPTVLIIDPSGRWGQEPMTVGTGYEGTTQLNNGIGDITITDDWQDYVDGEVRVTVVDIASNPTGYGAIATAELNAQGAVSSVTVVDGGSAYVTPQITIDGPVTYPGMTINNINTDLALYGPKGNSSDSPYSSNNQILTNFKNGVMVQFEQANGHSVGDSWEFKLQTWVKGTPNYLAYETYQYDGVLINTSGVIALQDQWEV